MTDYFEGYQILYDSINTSQAILSPIRKRLQSLPSDTEVLHLLDIGCADGQKTELFIEQIKSARPQQKIHMHLIEPSNDFLKLACKRLNPLVHELTYSCLTLEDFLQQPHSGIYDWIIAGNVFYHTDVKDLDSLAKKLSASGLLMVMMGGIDYPLEIDEELKKISFGDSSIVHRHLELSAINHGFHVSIDKVSTALKLELLYTPQSGLTSRGKKLISMLYKIPYDKFSEKQKTALEFPELFL